MPPPNLIAGPLLRSVEPSKVSVWCAFTTAMEVTLNVYEGEIKHKNDEAGKLQTDATPLPSSSSQADTIRFGKNLHVVVVTAQLNAPALQTDKTYSYNVLFKEGNTTRDLRSEGLLEEKKEDLVLLQLPIGYVKDTLPTFVLSEDDPLKLVIAQGSCHKLHGEGEDAMAHLDDIIGSHRNEEAPEEPEEETEEEETAETEEEPTETGVLANAQRNRPQQLFLTGDQIYADDAAGLLLQFLGQLNGTNERLVGKEKVQVQPINEQGVPQEAVDVEANTVHFPAYLRKQLVSKHASFTSSDSESHLISFEEFCGMYLHTWSLKAWNSELINKLKPLIRDPDDVAALKTLVEEYHEELMPAGGLSKPSSAEGFMFATIEEGIELEDGYEDYRDTVHHHLKVQLRSLARFLRKLPKISRVLANVPSYMIFDDHEVTDDWNISQRWVNSVYSKSLGRDIIRNALMAYAIFQDWGNVPGEYGERSGLVVVQKGENIVVGTNTNFTKADEGKEIKIKSEDHTIASVTSPNQISLTNAYNGDDDPEAEFKILTISPRRQLLQKIAEFGNRIANQNISSLRSDTIKAIDTLLGIGPEPPQIDWHYQVKTGPTFTFVLDIRTRRGFDSLNASPQLISEASLKEQTPESLPEGDQPFVFVVSPTPALGLSSFEELIQPAAARIIGLIDSTPENPGIANGQLKFDLEAWGFSVPALERLLARLDTYQRVIILSGDLHYGFSSHLDYWKAQSETPSSRIVQLTSSAFKNEWTPNIELFKAGFVQKVLTGFDNRLEKVGWKENVVNASGPVTAKNKQRLKQIPAVIPVKGWDPAASVEPEPEFRWRLDIVADERIREGDPFIEDIDPNDPESIREGYIKAVQLHTDTFVSGIGRRIVWNAHTSLIRFDELEPEEPEEPEEEEVENPEEGDEENEGDQLINRRFRLRHEFYFTKGLRGFPTPQEIEANKPTNHIVHLIPLDTPDAAQRRPELVPGDEADNT